MKLHIKLFALVALLAQLTATHALAQLHSDDDFSDFSAAYADDGNEYYPLSDPFEGFNRGVMDFNIGADRYFLRPLTQGYRYIVPEMGRDMVNNFLVNLQRPINFTASALQGDGENSFITMWRFIFDSTLGVLGLFDISTELGVPPQRNEDFGQMLATWGVGNGPYLVLPLLGPATARDFGANVGNWMVDPWNEAFKGYEIAARQTGEVLDIRSQNLNVIDQIYYDSIDPYSSMRSLYGQRRAALIADRGGYLDEDLRAR